MQVKPNHVVSGHVWFYAGKRRSTWYAKVRLPDGRQENRKIGPAWTEPRGRPPSGYFTEKTAEAALQAILTDARRGTLAGQVKTGATGADAIDEWLRHIEHERQRKRSTVTAYKNSADAHFRPTFGDVALERITTADIERWRGELLTGERSVRTVNKLVTELHGVFERARKVWKLPTNPVADVEPLGLPDSEPLDFYSPEEVWSLVRAAESEADAVLFLTASFAGLRMGELRALRLRDVDFAAETIRVVRNFTYGAFGSPKSGKGRAVPMASPVATGLAQLFQREHFMGDDDLAFPGVTGNPLDGSALRRRYKAARNRAKLRPLRFHDLRHTFGSLAINRASIVQVQAWMGHADIRTTMRYLHHKSRADDARLLAGAFEVGPREQAEPEAASREPSQNQALSRSTNS